MHDPATLSSLGMGMARRRPGVHGLGALGMARRRRGSGMSGLGAEHEGRGMRHHEGHHNVHHHDRHHGLPNARARAQFFSWLQGKHPEIFAAVANRVNLDALSDNATDSPATASPDTTASWFDNLTKNVSNITGALVGGYKDIKAFNVNLDRAKQNKPPISSDVSATRVQVGLPSQTNTILLVFGAAALGLGAFYVVKSTRRR